MENNELKCGWFTCRGRDLYAAYQAQSLEIQELKSQLAKYESVSNANIQVTQQTVDNNTSINPLTAAMLGGMLIGALADSDKTNTDTDTNLDGGGFDVE